MASAQPPLPTPSSEDPSWAARCLLRSAQVGSLATSADGHPFASLVTPACTPDLSILLLLSRLSPHTRHLEQDPRCSLLVTGTQATANPQTTPRVTVMGAAERVDDARAKARFLAIHPYASLYADFGDFGVWRIQPNQGQFVGGFARAHRLKTSDLTPDSDAVARVLAAEAGIIAHCNQDHPDALAAIAGSPGNWRMVTADVDGCDLALGERVIRIAWSAPAKDAGDIRRELVRLAHEARAKGSKD